MAGGGRARPAPSRILRIVAGVNQVVLGVALAVAAADWFAPANAVVGFVAWPPDGRDIEVVDRTGDAAWHEATRHAVSVWDGSTSGVDLRLRWAPGEGECEQRWGRIEICQVPRAELSESGLEGQQGIARQQAQGGYGRSAVVAVCADCRLSERRRRVVAAHELGHALGMEHTLRRTSIMFPLGAGDRPDGADYQRLRELYDPAGPGRPRCPRIGPVRLGWDCA